MVKHAMAEIETFASTRKMELGEATLNKTDNIIAALFMRDTNRNLEPQLHTVTPSSVHLHVLLTISFFFLLWFNNA